MSRSLRLAVAAAVLAALVLGSVSATIAGGPKVLDARMVGIPTNGLVLHGITGGGVPWAIDEGRAKLFADGRLQVEVRGLVVASSGVNPVATGRAIVTCSSVAVASSGAVPFSPTGDADRRHHHQPAVDRASPRRSSSPAITGQRRRWFAVTGS